MLKDPRQILAALNAHGVKNLVVGGHTVSIHAEPRGTKALDVFLKADMELSVPGHYTIARSFTFRY